MLDATFILRDLQLESQISLAQIRQNSATLKREKNTIRFGERKGE